MTAASALSAALLAPRSIDDERFFQATALLATRLNLQGEHGDLRTDRDAPQLLFDWFRHAAARVPDLRVWDLSCQLEAFFDPARGLYLPHSWPWDTRDRLLELNEQLRGRPGWAPVFERALVTPQRDALRGLVCCAAEMLRVDPYPMLWAYLCEHTDDAYIWHLIDSMIDEGRLPHYLELARMTLLDDGSVDVPGGGADGDLGRGPDGDAARPLAGYLSPGEPSDVLSDELWIVWAEVLASLRRFPGEGIDLIERALHSADSGVRNRALDVLTIYWKGRGIPADTLNLLGELATIEDDATALRSFEILLAAR